MKTRLFWDTNVMLDLLGERVPFYEPVAKIATLADNGEIQIVVSALSYVTVGYFLTKYESVGIAKEKLRKFRIISEICNLDDGIIEKGLDSSFPDFEDSIQYLSALKAGCTLLITRNGKDFKESELPVMTAEEYLASINRK
jgi:predicted nucleic acid-binding protein